MSNAQRNRGAPAELAYGADPGDRDGAAIPIGSSGTRPVSRPELPTRTDESMLPDSERTTLVAVAAPATGRESIDVVFDDDDTTAQLAATCLERLGGRDAVPFVAVSPQGVRSLPLDPWSGFLWSLIDGLTSVQDILDIAPMPEHEVLRVLNQLYECGLIKVRLRQSRE